ncbi:colicin release lysis protein [Escherichia coli]|nr:hypothetical protein [Escherichia coli]
MAPSSSSKLTGISVQ